MKILHINQNFLKSSLYKNLSKSLIQNGCDLKVIFATLVNNKSLIEEPYIKQLSILKRKDKFLFKHRAKKVFNNIDKIENITKYNVTHAHSLFSNGYVSYLIKKKYNTPYIVAVRNTDLNRFFKKRPLLRGVGIKILKEAEQIIFLSESYRNEMLERYISKDDRKKIKNKIKIIPNGIEDYWHSNVPTKVKQKPENKIKILSVGVINKTKNNLASVNACKILLKQNKNVELTIVGEVKDSAILKKIKKNDFVNYVPKVNKEELLNYYRESHIFLMPSLTETFGLVYVEAMSQGLPVLYSKGQGFDQQFEDGVVGFSVEKKSPEDIANKVLLIINSYKSLSYNCLQLVGKFDWDKIAKEYISIYQDIID